MESDHCSLFMDSLSTGAPRDSDLTGLVWDQDITRLLRCASRLGSPALAPEGKAQAEAPSLLSYPLQTVASLGHLGHHFPSQAPLPHYSQPGP